MEVVKHRYSETPDVTAEMVRKGYTPQRIFKIAEEFFTSLGMAPMSPEFWRNSILQQPSDDRAPPKCTASAWDFCNNFDFRVKQCTQITLEDFINTHYEISHVQYYMLYANQPFVYRDGPNPAFHEAIGTEFNSPSNLLTYPIGSIDIFSCFSSLFHFSNSSCNWIGCRWPCAFTTHRTNEYTNSNSKWQFCHQY